MQDDSKFSGPLMGYHASPEGRQFQIVYYTTKSRVFLMTQRNVTTGGSWPIAAGRIRVFEGLRRGNYGTSDFRPVTFRYRAKPADAGDATSLLASAERTVYRPVTRDCIAGRRRRELAWRCPVLVRRRSLPQNATQL